MKRRLLAAALAALGMLALLAYTVIGPSRVASAWSTQQITAKALTDHDCDSGEWEFVITQVDVAADAPASIQVSWANGASENVALGSVTGGVAHYVSTDNLDSVVVSASAQIYASWSGEFNLSHGPCAKQSSPPPSTSSAPPSTSSAPPSTSTTPPSISSAPPSTSSAPPSTSSAPGSSSAPVSSSGSGSMSGTGSTSAAGSGSAPVGAPSAGSSSAGPVVAGSSPFVPGPGQTGDDGSGSGSVLKWVLLGLAVALLGSASAMAIQQLRRRGNHA